MKFAHLSDCHIGGWREDTLRDVNLKSFEKAIEICIENHVGFIIIAGDLFDTALPSIEILKRTAKILSKLKEYDIPVIADGGIQKSGDISKALAAGADTVMIGSLFAGTDESPGVSINKNGRKYKFYRGMASFHASVNRQTKETEIKNHKPIDKIVPEGVESLVPYTGNIKELLHQLLGGLKSGMSYCGARTIKELHQNAEFVKISWAGLKESHPHDVDVVEKF